jgi:hypothetical protein
VDGGLSSVDGIEADERVDLKVGEMQIDVDGVEAGKEVDEGVLLGRRDIVEKGRGNRLARGEGLANGDRQTESLGVNIANVNATFVREEDLVAFALRVDTDVVFSVGRVREEGLDNEVGECANGALNL